MNKKTLYIIIAIIVVIAIGAIFYFKGDTGPRIIGYSHEEGVVSAATFQLSKVEMWGISSATSTPGRQTLIGPMELVESSENGQQTWIFPIPEKPAIVKQLFIKGYNDKGREVKNFELPYKTAEEIQATFWPNRVSFTGIEGSVVGLAPATRAITVKIKEGNVVVTLSPNAKVVNQNGQAVPFSTLKIGTKVLVSGDYRDEGKFDGTEVEIIPGTTTPTVSVPAGVQVN